MADHRVRLDDYELELIVISLTALAAGASSSRRADFKRLAQRLMGMCPGNPYLMYWGQLLAPPTMLDDDMGLASEPKRS